MVANPIPKERALNSHLFLLLGLGYSLDGSGPQRPPPTVSTVSFLSARVRPVLLVEQGEKRVRADMWHWCGYGRLLIDVDAVEGSELAARRICDGLQSLLAVIGELRPSSGFAPYEIPRTIMKRGRIRRRDLESIKSRRNSYLDSLDFANAILGTMTISGARMAHMFFHLPTVVREPSLFDAAHFYQEAIQDFQFAGDDIREILAEPEAQAQSEADRVALESATLNSLRAIEAIVGEPGKEERFRNHLLAVGINPDRKVGYEGEPELKISDRIRWLQDLRDETSGHGRRRRREPLKFREVMEAQDLARAVVRESLVHFTSSRGRTDGEPAEKRFLLGQMFGHKAMRRIRDDFPTEPAELLVERPGGLQRIIDALAE